MANLTAHHNGGACNPGSINGYITNSLGVPSPDIALNYTSCAMNVLSKNVHYLIHAHNILPDFPTDQSEASYVLMGTGLGHAYKPFTNFHIATQIDTSAGAKTVNISVQHNDSDAIPSYFKPGDRITLMARKTGSNDCYINYSADDFFLLACNNSTNTETIKENYVREFIFDGYKFVNVNDNC